MNLASLLADAPFGSCPPRARRREVLLLALAGLAFALALHGPVLLGRVPFPADIPLSFPPWESMRVPKDFATRHAEMGDVAVQVWAFRTLLARAVSEGSVPWWNPSLLMGAPLAANAQSAVFYPFSLPYLLLPLPAAWSLATVLRSALAFWLAALAARELGSSRLGALVSAGSYATCGFLTAWEGWTNSDAAVWLPAVILATGRLLRTGSARWVAVSGVTYALPVLAGHPEVALYVAGTGAAFFVWHAARMRGQALVRTALSFAAAVHIAVGLAAVQILPTLEWLSHTAREPNAGKLFPPRPLSEAVAFFSRDLFSNPNTIGVWIPEGAAYAGLVTLFLLPFAFLEARRSTPAFFGLLLTFAVMGAYGLPPVHQLIGALPVFRHLPNYRLVLLADFSIAMLAGLGLTALARERPALEDGPPRGRMLVRAFSLPAVGVCWTLARIVPTGWAGLRAGGLAILGAAVVLAGLAALLLMLRARRISRESFEAALVGLSLVDGATFAAGHVPYFRPDRIWPEPAVVTRLRSGGEDPYRVVALDGSMPINAEAVYGLSTPSGYDFVLARVRAFLLPLTRSDDSFLLSQFDAESVVTERSRRLDMANVRYLVTTTWNRSTDLLAADAERFREVWREGRVVVFENLRCLPRAILVLRSGVRTAKDGAEALSIVSSPEFDPLREAVVEGALPDAAPAAASGGGRGAAQFLRQLSDEAALRVEVPSRSLLVVAETWYPGWRAQVDGREAPIVRANHVFRGVWLEPGERHVVFHYRPPSVLAGGAVTLATLAVTMALLLRRSSARPRRRSDEPGGKLGWQRDR